MTDALVDSHCHLDLLDYGKLGGDTDAAVDAAHVNGVAYMLCVSINLEHYPEMLALTRRYANVYASVGVHPNERDGREPDIETLRALAADEKVIAIGETGLDYFRSEGDLEWQRDRFRTHIRAAKKAGKPLIIHSREAREDTLRIMREEQAADIGGVMHCFTENWEMARQAMEMNFYISFSGIVTFKSATQLQEVARRVPLDRMLVETDSPYLAPVPYRGKTNQPAYVRHVAEKIAQLRGDSYEHIAEMTTRNFFTLFSSARARDAASSSQR
jgi:TatD DNase family protein